MYFLVVFANCTPQIPCPYGSFWPTQKRYVPKLSAGAPPLLSTNGGFQKKCTRKRLRFSVSLFTKIITRELFGTPGHFGISGEFLRSEDPHMSPGDTLGCNVDSYLIAMSTKTIVRHHLMMSTCHLMTCIVVSWSSDDHAWQPTHHLMMR